MDLIYMNESLEDVGVLIDATMDVALGVDENDFECGIALQKHCCKEGFYLYYDGTEYGGIIDKIKVDTKSKEVSYLGRTWHGILESKILCPDEGEAYLIVSGEANAVIGALIERLGLSSLFSASEEDSGIEIISYKVNRYIGGYDGIKKMLKSVGAKLKLKFSGGKVILSAARLVDYSQDEQFDSDQLEFKVTKNYAPINHCICLGKGELTERQVIHLNTDTEGNISDTQSIFGLEERTAVYENANVESLEELEQGGRDLIRESWKSDEIGFSFNSNDESYDIGDIVGAQERTTGIFVSAEIIKKIVKIDKGKTTINYKVGE